MKLLLLMMITALLTGCTHKDPCISYSGFAIVEKPKPIKLKIKSDRQKLLKSIHMLSEMESELNDEDREKVREVIQYLSAAVDNETALAALKSMKVKIKVLEKIIDQYESEIRDYWEFQKRNRR